MVHPTITDPMGETVMSRQDDTIEAAVYRIKKFGAHSYTISKSIMGVEGEDYQITIKHAEFEQEVWCNCPGFRIQQFPHIQHKHIKIGLDFQSRGEPEWAEYRMTGTGKKAKIHFVRDSNA